LQNVITLQGIFQSVSLSRYLCALFFFILAASTDVVGTHDSVSSIVKQDTKQDKS